MTKEHLHHIVMALHISVSGKKEAIRHYLQRCYTVALAGFFNSSSSMEAWDLASGAYAEQVSGEIRVIVGSELRLGNIWENVELPKLIENPDVTKITTIDPKTGVETIIFER